MYMYMYMYLYIIIYIDNVGVFIVNLLVYIFKESQYDASNLCVTKTVNFRNSTELHGTHFLFWGSAVMSYYFLKRVLQLSAKEHVYVLLQSMFWLICGVLRKKNLYLKDSEILIYKRKKKAILSVFPCTQLILLSCLHLHRDT